MFSRLLLLFIIVPLMDLFLLLFLASYLTWQVTVLIVILSGILGAWLVTRQSRFVRNDIHDRLQRNQLPTGVQITNGAIVLFAAGMLITPGIITDLFGLSLLVPPIRNFYKSLVKHWFRDRIQFQSFTLRYGSGFQSPFSNEEDVVEGQVKDKYRSGDEDHDSVNKIDS